MKISNEVLDVLGKCMVEGKVVMLSAEHLDRKLYLEVNKCLQGIGGNWNKMARGHMFDYDPTELLENLILTGETVNLKKEMQFYETPEKIAGYIVSLAELKTDDYVLEPSAGKGAIAEEILSSNVNIELLTMVEMNNLLYEGLRTKFMDCDVQEGDFLLFAKHSLVIYDKVIMNPPFTKQQDIDHVLVAFKILKPGGILVSIMSEGTFFRTNKKASEFRDFLTENNADITAMDPGAFKQSGTMVRTRIVKIKKSSTKKGEEKSMVDEAKKNGAKPEEKTEPKNEEVKGKGDEKKTTVKKVVKKKVVKKKKPKGKPGELPMDIPETPIGKVTKELATIREKISELDSEAGHKKTEITKLMKEKRQRKITMCGLTMVIKPSGEKLEVKKA